MSVYSLGGDCFGPSGESRPRNGMLPLFPRHILTFEIRADVGLIEPDRFQLARRQQDHSHREKVIFAVGICKTIRGVRICLTEDVRHAVGVAQNPDVVALASRLS